MVWTPGGQKPASSPQVITVVPLGTAKIFSPGGTSPSVCARSAFRVRVGPPLSVPASSPVVSKRYHCLPPKRSTSDCVEALRSRSYSDSIGTASPLALIDGPVSDVWRS